MKMKRGYLVGIVGLLYLLCVPDVIAQYEHLKPQHWFPLEVGNYWHYAFESPVAYLTHVVWASERDTTMAGKRWTRLAQVYCTGGPLCQNPISLWYHWTDDYYLLSKPSLDIVGADTLLSTQPRSIFTVNTAHQTLHSWRVPSPVEVRIEPNESGNEADSTNLMMLIDHNIFFEGKFIYNIGQATHLVGALVNGIAYGDTKLITSVALSTEEPEILERSRFPFDIYPNPFYGQTTIRFLATQHGSYEVIVYNLLGQRIALMEKWLSSGQEGSFLWSSRNGLGAGIYLVQIKRDKMILATKSLVSVN